MKDDFTTNSYCTTYTFLGRIYLRSKWVRRFISKSSFPLLFLSSSSAPETTSSSSLRRLVSRWALVCQAFRPSLASSATENKITASTRLRQLLSSFRVLHAECEFARVVFTSRVLCSRRACCVHVARVVFTSRVLCSRRASCVHVVRVVLALWSLRPRTCAKYSALFAFKCRFARSVRVLACGSHVARLSCRFTASCPRSTRRALLGSYLFVVHGLAFTYIVDALT